MGGVITGKVAGGNIEIGCDTLSAVGVVRMSGEMGGIGVVGEVAGAGGNTGGAITGEVATGLTAFSDSDNFKVAICASFSAIIFCIADNFCSNSTIFCCVMVDSTAATGVDFAGVSFGVSPASGLDTIADFP